MTMRIGRLGVDATLDNPADWRATADSHTITGRLLHATVADRMSVRRELISYAREKTVEAITYSADATLDGFYSILNADVEATAQDKSVGSGRIPFALDVEWVGDHSTVEFLSNYAGLLVNNDHGLTEGEVTFWHAPPVAGDDAYTAGGGTSATERTTEDGVIPVFLDIPLTDKIGSARWGCSPANFYKGAARIDVNGYTRVGRLAPMTPESFVLGNGLVELRAEASGGATIGDIAIRGFNPTNGWGSWIPFDIVWNATTDIPEWHLFNIVRNDPAAVVVQLVRDADEAPPTDNRHWLTFTLRRGAPLVRCHFTYSASVALTIDRAIVDAATAITPTGATSAMAARDTTADSDGAGNQWVIGAAHTSAVDTTNGGIDMATAASHSFFMGFQIDGASADTDNDANAMARQYLADLTESVQAVLR